MEREVHEKVSKSLEHKLKIIKLWPLRIGISSIDSVTSLKNSFSSTSCPDISSDSSNSSFS